MKKEVSKDKVFQYTGPVVPVGTVKPKFLTEAFKRRQLYYAGNFLMIKNSFKKVTSQYNINEIVNKGDYLLEDEEGILTLVKQKDFNRCYNITE